MFWPPAPATSQPGRAAHSVSSLEPPAPQQQRPFSKLLHFNKEYSAEGCFRSFRLFFHRLSHGLLSEEVCDGSLPIPAKILCFFWQRPGRVIRAWQRSADGVGPCLKTRWYQRHQRHEPFSSGLRRWMMSWVQIHFQPGVNNNIIFKGTMMQLLLQEGLHTFPMSLRVHGHET